MKTPLLVYFPFTNFLLPGFLGSVSIARLSCVYVLWYLLKYRFFGERVLLIESEAQEFKVSQSKDQQREIIC